MRTTVCIILMVAFLSSCEGQHQAPSQAAEPSFDSPSGPVTVLDLVRNEQEKRIEATILVGGCKQHLTIRPPQGAPLPVGLCADLTDNDSGLLFGLQLAWDRDTSDCVWLSEKTESDWLTLFVQRTGKRRTEKYNVNGEAYSVDYPIIESEANLRRFVDSMPSVSLPTEEAAAEAKELVAKFADFEEFYGRHLDNTLQQNADGELLAFLLNDEGFVSYLMGQDYHAARDYALAGGDKSAGRICAIASLCAGFKCALGGGIANPVCVACAGTSTACAIAKIACWIANCED